MNPTINVHEYPEGADHRTLLQYKIAVMQAFLRGAAIEARVHAPSFDGEATAPVLAMLGLVPAIPLDGNWHPVAPVHPGEPNFNWAHYDYRAQKPPAIPVLKDRFFRPGDGLFQYSIARGNVPHCIVIHGNGTSSYKYVDGEVITAPDHGVLPFLLGYCIRAASRGHWVEFDGDLTPWKPKPVPAPHWTDKLPREYADLAKKRRQEYVASPCRIEHFDDCRLMWSFLWKDTPEGHEFWHQVRQHLDGAGADNPLPPIPPSSVLPPPQPAKLAPKKLVPLDPGTLPLPCVMRHKNPLGGRWVVTCAHDTGVFMGTGRDETSRHSWEDLKKEFEYSIDHGKTWHPCSREA